MKVLLINTTCKQGSTGKITYGMYRKLTENGHEAIVAYGRGLGDDQDPNLSRVASEAEVIIHAAVSRLTGYTGTFSLFSTGKLIRMIDDFDPDVVQLYNLHGYYIDIYKLFRHLSKKNRLVVYSMLDEYPYLGKCCYSYDCSKFQSDCKGSCSSLKDYPKSMFFNRASSILEMKEKAYRSIENIVFAGPEWVVERAKSSRLLKDYPLEIVDEFVDTEAIFFPREAAQLRKTLGIEDQKIIILNVAPFSDPRKGGSYFVALAEKIVDRNYVFVHVGYDGPKEGLPDNFIPISYVRDQDQLAQYYSMADLLLCTSMADTMPNVCLEALSCGTPVCGFEISGIPYVAPPELGAFVPPGDVEALGRVVKQTKKKTGDIIKACRDYARQRYSAATYYQKMMAVYQKYSKKEIRR